MSSDFSRTKLASQIVNRIELDGTKELAKKIAAYLIDNAKTGELNSLIRDIIQTRKIKTNIVELTAISAHELERKQIDEITELVKKISPNAEKVIVNNQIDSDVIGGVRLEFANHLLDLSASAKLSKLKQVTVN